MKTCCSLKGGSWGKWCKKYTHQISYAGEEDIYTGAVADDINEELDEEIDEEIDDD